MSKFDINPDTGLNSPEQLVMDNLVEAFNVYIQLPQDHPDEMNDFKDGIHKLQNLLAVRVARRTYPAGWYANQRTVE